jgi:hypothetical protein
MIIRAPDIVWPARGCPNGRGWITVSLMGKAHSRQKNRNFRRD